MSQNPSPVPPDPVSAPSQMPPSSPGSQADGGGDIPAAEIEKGKILAILSYIIPLVGIILLFVKDNRFSLYHAKQVVTLLIFVIPLSFLSIIPLLGCVIGPVTMLACLACVIMGIINVVNHRTKPLPVIGALGEKWFAGIQAKPAV